jgi:hypothetical protein
MWSNAPDDTFATTGVNPTARRSGMKMPWTPAASVEDDKKRRLIKAPGMLENLIGAAVALGRDERNDALMLLVGD